MTSRLALSLLVFGFSVTTLASFPSRVTVQLKNKMSCRDVRKLLKPSHLYVNCQLNSMRTSEYSAEYLGQQPLPKVIAELSSNAKVQGIGEEVTEPSTDLQETVDTQATYRPVQGSVN